MQKYYIIYFYLEVKYLKYKKKNTKFNKSISLEDNLVTNFLQKYKAKKASKKSLKNKLKIGLIKPLTSNKANRRKGKAVIITKTDKEVIVKKAQLK